MSTKKLQVLGDSLSIEVTDEQVSAAVNEYLTENPVASVKGDDGVSPTVTVTTITGGHRVTITDASDTRFFDVMDGEDGTDAVGTPGTNGVSPTISVSAIDGGHKVTITDVNGTKTFNVMDGSDGGSGAGIDDDRASTTTTYSSSKIDALLNEQKEAIDDKLDASELPTAINTALEQAKESGQFDGKDGEPGDDYVLTEEDKQEIAGMVTGPSYTLPVATSEVLGGVKPAAKTDEMTQEVGVDELGGLWALPGGGGGVGEWKQKTITLEENVESVVIEVENATDVCVRSSVCVTDADGLNTGSTPFMFKVNNFMASRPDIYTRESLKINHVWYIKKINNRLVVLCTEPWGNGSTFANRYAMNINGDDSTKADEAETISSLEYFLSVSTLFMKSGSVWEVWYR